MDAMKKVFECGLVPVIKLDDANDALPLCKALLDGGLSVAEITFRTDAAEESIRKVSQELPDVLVGAGTVLNVEMAKKAKAAGAQFLVTPGINRPVLEYGLENGLIVFPGCSNPSDLEVALSYGLDVVKFFPAEASGGLKAIKAMSGPYGMLKFMPTGGIDINNLGDYLKFDKIVACGGTWMVNDALIKGKKFDEVTRISKEAVMKIHGFSFWHMAINPEEGQTAKGIADQFTNAFGFDQRNTSLSIFSDNNTMEIMLEKGPGLCGHIAVKTNNVARAIAYLERKGFEVDRSTARGPTDAPTFIYLKESFGPFAVHLIQ